MTRTLVRLYSGPQESPRTAQTAGGMADTCMEVSTMSNSTRESRFWAKVDPDGDCWEWTAGVTGAGYGLFGWREHGRPTSVMAHRYAWTLLVGEIEPGKHLDHLCRNTICVNPDHLQPVTPRENTLRGYGPSAENATKTHCNQGHPFDEENTYHYDGHRACLTCRRKRSAEYNAEVSARRAKS